MLSSSCAEWSCNGNKLIVKRILHFMQFYDKEFLFQSFYFMQHPAHSGQSFVPNTFTTYVRTGMHRNVNICCNTSGIRNLGLESQKDIVFMFIYVWQICVFNFFFDVVNKICIFSKSRVCLITHLHKDLNL